jgi:hypothetical protein
MVFRRGKDEGERSLCFRVGEQLMYAIFFEFREVVCCCASRFAAKYRLVKLNEEGKMHIPLRSSTFERMLCLSEATKIFKISDADAFLDAHGGGFCILNKWHSK